MIKPRSCRYINIIQQIILTAILPAFAYTSAICLSRELIHISNKTSISGLSNHKGLKWRCKILYVKLCYLLPLRPIFLCMVYLILQQSSTSCFSASDHRFGMNQWTSFSIIIIRIFIFPSLYLKWVKFLPSHSLLCIHQIAPSLTVFMLCHIPSSLSFA